MTLKDAPVTPLSGGRAALEKFLQSAAILLAFEGLGGADAAMDMALTYSKDRVAFGRKIAGYQAVKHRLADMYIKNQLARSHAYYGAWALLTDAPELVQAAAGARLAAMDAFQFAAEENVQLHGGIGIYRLALKWGWLTNKSGHTDRQKLQKVKWGITGFFLALGLLTHCTGKRKAASRAAPATSTVSRWSSREGPSYHGMALPDAMTLSPLSAATGIAVTSPIPTSAAKTR